MKYKKLGKKFIILSGLLLASLQAEATVPQKNKRPSSIPQNDFSNPFGGEGAEGPPQLPMDNEMAPPQKAGQKGLPSRKASANDDFSGDFGPLPPDAGMPDDLPPLPEEKPEQAPVPAKEEPAPFSWDSIDLHNLAKQAGRKVDPYRASGRTHLNSR